MRYEYASHINMGSFCLFCGRCEGWTCRGSEKVLEWQPQYQNRVKVGRLKAGHTRTKSRWFQGRECDRYMSYPLMRARSLCACMSPCQKRLLTGCADIVMNNFFHHNLKRMSRNNISVSFSASVVAMVVVGGRIGERRKKKQKDHTHTSLSLTDTDFRFLT